MNLKKLTAIFSTAVLLLTAILPALPVHGEGEIYRKTVRLHVIASSDGEEDQAVKLLVRDAILAEIGKTAEGCASGEEAAEKLEKTIPALRETALAVLRREGKEEKAEVTLSEERYPTREYGSFRLPAGDYLSLRVILGEGKGKNWWCVLFPPLCTSAAEAKDTLAAVGFTPSQIRLLTDSENPKYVLRFKILEWIGTIFS